MLKNEGTVYQVDVECISPLVDHYYYGSVPNKFHDK